MATNPLSLDTILRRKRMVKRVMLESKQQIDTLYSVKDLQPKHIAAVKVQKDELVVLMNEYKDILLQGLDICSDQNEESELFRDDQEFRKMYIENSSKLQEISNRLAAGSINESLNATSIDVNPAIKLPKINLKKFSGNIVDFPSFFDLFSNLVHNDKSLSNVQKLYYLKDALTDDAYNLIRDFDITDANYLQAFSLLRSRYENKRLIIMKHLKDLFELAPVSSQTSLRNLVDNTSKSLRAMEALGEPSVKTLLCYIVSSKLDRDTRELFELSITDNKNYPTYEQLMAFLDARAAVVETLQIASSKGSHHVENKNKSFRNNKVSKSFATANNNICVLCKGQHLLANCKRFSGKSPLERFDIIKKFGLCIGCFETNHSVSKCKQAECCICHKPHHSLLHRKVDKNNTPRTEEIASDVGTTEPTCSNGVCLKSSTTESGVILPTAIVHVLNRYRQRFLVRLLSDSASQVNLISENLVKRLKLNTYTKRSPVMGIGGHVTCARACKLTVCSRFNDFVLEFEALVIPSIVSSYNIDHLSSLKWPTWFNVNLAEDDSYNKSSVDILLGAEYYELITKNNSVTFDSLPFVRETEFGWVVSGKSNLNVNTESVQNCCMVLEDNLKKFCDIEEVPAHATSKYTDEQLRCEAHFESTFSRDVDGRFIVKLPFKEDPSSLTNNRSSVCRLFHKTEKRLCEEYRRFIKEYYTLGHMEIAPPLKGNDCFYFPHHSVIKETSTSTRLRVVFNGSWKGPNLKSLNDVLMVGPVIQNDLFTILIRFRTHNVAFTCDCEKMYRQIIVAESDRDYQRIVWRSSVDEPVVDYRLTRITYGTASASFIATKCLKILSLSVSDKYPRAAEVISYDVYMDDVMTGENTLEGALVLQDQIHNTLQSGAFPLRKYMSNSEAFLSSIPDKWCEGMQLDHNLHQETINILGVIWCPSADTYSISVKLPLRPNKFSKRIILSEISKIFDPLGFLAPVVIVVKILLQSMWLENISWDDPLSKMIETTYLQFRNKLYLLENLRIPRRFSFLDNYISIELHGFSDSSERAYAACIYVRCIDQYSNVSVRLLCSKTRVAPIKTISVPRLELCASLLLSRLMNKVFHGLSISNAKIFAWTDSTVVLSWLSKPSCYWKNFVANRVSKIIELIPCDQWSHVSTNNNPADLGTRGISIDELLDNKLWFNGPAFLHNSVISIKPNKFETTEEVKNSPLCCLVVDNVSILDKCSSYNTLINIISYCLRFLNNSKLKVIGDRKTGPLQVCERRIALNAIIRMVQLKAFYREIDCLKNSKFIPRHSCLSTLNPFIDEIGILRVGGRISNASLAYDTKHPIILPKDSLFTESLIRYYHLVNLHASLDTLRLIISQTYWIIRGRSIIRKITRRCLTCFRQNYKLKSQQMGNLPIGRVNVACPFQICGVDYAGPFVTKSSPVRSKVTFKSYIVVIVCFSIKAIHLELVSDLSTNSFLAAFKRFIARRGKPTRVYSDNGTNFIGAASHLRDLANFIQDIENSDNIIKWFSNEMIEWKFIPPSSPNFGGLWEANVKSIKTILHKVVGETIMSFEVFYTLLCQIESILNSRPLCSVPNDQDLDILTPAHFLLGKPLSVLPDLPLPQNKINLSDLRLHMQVMIQSFWKRWQHEYLISLQTRSKWRNPTNNVNVGDVVLLVDKSAPPTSWRMGRIIQICPGSDQLVRVVKVKTAHGEYLRPTSKVAVLPISIPTSAANCSVLKTPECPVPSIGWSMDRK